MPSSRYMAYSPSPSAPHSPHISGIRSATTVIVEQEKYLSELLAERHNLGPFMQVLPHSCRLLNQDYISKSFEGSLKILHQIDGYNLQGTRLDAHILEILRISTLLGNASLLDQSGREHGSPLTTGGSFSNGGAADRNGWASMFQSERLGSVQPSAAHGWLGSQGGSSGLIVKKTIRVDIPVDKYPNFNFVGRLLGPRGNSLKRVEATTECRVLIRGRGSIKDPTREDLMRGKAGYEHLNEPLHILVEAEFPVEIVDGHLMQAREIIEDMLKPVDESQDLFKKQQLRELALLNGTLRDEGSRMSVSVSPFNDSLGLKRAKTRG